MSKIKLLGLLLWISLKGSIAGEITKVYTFNDPVIEHQGIYSLICFDGCRIFGEEGKASLPFYPVELLLPPGEMAVAVNIEYEHPKIIDGDHYLLPRQAARPVSGWKYSLKASDSSSTRS